MSRPPDRTTATLGRPRDELREQAMLDAALELLVEVGYDKLSVDAITARSRASKATFYRRWANKSDVVAEALRRFKSHCNDVAERDTGSLRGDLLAKVSALCSGAALDGQLVAGVLRAMRSDPALAEIVQHQVLGGESHPAIRLAERAVQRGELVAGAPVDLAFEVATSMILSRSLLGDGRSDDEFAEHLVDEILLPLLSARPTGSGEVRRMATAPLADRVQPRPL